MRWFIPVVLSVYFLMHAYVYLRFIKGGIKSERIRKLVLLVFAYFMFSPFIWRYADRNFDAELTYFIVFTGLLWMGFLLYVVVFGILLELYEGFVFLSKRFLGINPLPTPKGGVRLLIVLLLAFSLSAYGYYETLNLRVERITIYSDKISKDSVKVLHISDMHLGPVMGMDKIRLVYEVYKREKPDLIVSTGDLVDGNMRNKTHLADALKAMEAPLGKYAVLGNHEYYRGLEQAIGFTQRAGFLLLRGKSHYIPQANITVVGIDDDDCRFFYKCEGPLYDYELLKSADQKSFVLYLKHKPKVEPTAVGLFDLMLSGHTHGGVYYPVGKLILTRLFITDRGFVKLGDGYLYVSKGVGTGGPPIRLFSPPDVAVIHIVKTNRRI